MADNHAPSRLALAWYFHLPSIATPIEVRDHARRSLKLLLRIHKERQAHVLVAPTGAFLALCRRDAPDTVDELNEMAASGLVTIAATYFHEVDPFSISWMHLREQIRRDVASKTDLTSRPLAWFLAPNFAWHPSLETFLPGLGILGAVLDSRHLAAATSARAWSWSTERLGGVTATDTPTFVSPWEHRRLRLATNPAGEVLRLAFRDWPMTRALTFGNDAEIHRPERDIAAVLSTSSSHDLVVLADDGDRVGPQSRRGYEELLEHAAHIVDWTSLIAEESELPPLRELPAFSQPGFDELLRTSLDARMYWSLLDQIASQPLKPTQLTRLLALQEIFYPFWKGCGRRRWYLDRAVELLEEVQG